MKYQIIGGESIKNKVFDGLETDFYRFELTVPKYVERVISLDKITEHDFKDLAEKMNAADFAAILKQGDFHMVSGIFPHYTGSDNLPLTYTIVDNRLLVFASGEYQPARFKIYLEGIWELQPEAL